MHPNLFCSSAMYIMLHDWFLVVLMHAWFQLVSTLKIMYCLGCGSGSNIPGIACFVNNCFTLYFSNRTSKKYKELIAQCEV